MKERKKGLVFFETCSMLKCNDVVGHRSHSGLCKFHQRRVYDGVKLDRPRGIKGENNPNWNGGTSEYPNHSLMKKIRREVLEEANYTCQYCGNFTNQIHHKDLSKDNHSKKNFAACCNKCNLEMAGPRKAYDSKYRRLYNFSAKEMSDKLNLKIFKIYKLHRQNKLKELI